MWQRRGNYALLFVLTAAVMLSYLAFSIDGGRMRLAAVQAENAAEAATLAAMVTIRDGGTRNEAEGAAQTAANMVRMQRIGGGDTTESAYSVDIDWGEWAWNRQVEGPSLEDRWDQQGNRTQAVTVNVSLNQPMATIFGPAIKLVGRRQGGTQGGTWSGGSGSNTDEFNVKVGARAALKNRDMVVVVDVSRYAEPVIDDIQDALADFVGLLDERDVPGDRLSVIAYAGREYVYPLDIPGAFQGIDGTSTVDPITNLGGVRAPVVGQPNPPFYEIGPNIADIQETLESMETCFIGSEEFYRFYRHVVAASSDTELNDGEIGATGFEDFSYYIIGTPGSDGGGPTAGPGFRVNSPYFTFELRERMFDMLEARFLNQAIPALLQQDPSNPTIPCVNSTDWRDLFQCYWEDQGGVLPEVVQCLAWDAIHEFYVAQDLRRQRSMWGAGVGAQSPLSCHEGNYWETLASSIDPVASPIPALGCLPLGADPADPVDRPDYAFSQAGSNPGSALQRAVTMFQNNVSNAEPTVIVITPTAPRCGPVIESNGGVAGPCQNDLFVQAANALTDLEDLEANVYVLGLVGEGSDDEAVMSLWDGIGRGYYETVSNSSALPAALAEIAADMKIQVVQ